MIKKTCEICGREFEAHHKSCKVCSQECANKRAKRYREQYNKPIIHYCEMCGKEIPNNKTYCTECAEIRRQERIARQKAKIELETLEKVCIICGKTFYTKRSKQINCSPECTKIYTKIGYLKDNTYSKEDEIITPKTFIKDNKFGSFENFLTYAKSMLQGIDLTQYFNK